MALRRTLVSLPFGSPSTSTAAAGCVWRRLLSDGSRRTEEELKALAEKAAAAAADAAKSAAAAADAAEKAAADAAKAAAAADAAKKNDVKGEKEEISASGTMTEEGCRILVEVEVNRALQEFDSMLRAHRVHLDKRFGSLQMSIDGYSVGAASCAESVDLECKKRALKVDGELDKRKAYHEELNNISNAKIRDTQYFPAKLAAGSCVAFIALYAVDHFFNK